MPTRVAPAWSGPGVESGPDLKGMMPDVRRTKDDTDAFDGAVYAQEKLSTLLDGKSLFGWAVYLYRKRIRTLRQHASAIMRDQDEQEREKAIATADAAAKRIADGMVKEQETLALVGALFLSIAANTINEMPADFQEQFANHYIAYYVPDVYVWTSVLSIACLTASIGCSVLCILEWNKQEDDDAYGDLVVFLAQKWHILAVAPFFCVWGLMFLAGNLYCVVWGYYFQGKISTWQPYFLGVALYGGLIYLGVVLPFLAMLRQLTEPPKPPPQCLAPPTRLQPIPGSVQVPIWPLQEQAFGAESPAAKKKRPKRNGSRGQLGRTKSGSPTKVAVLHAEASLPGEASD